MPVPCGSSAVPESAEPVNALAVLPVPAIGRQVAPAFRLAAVGIDDTVGIGELAGADDRATPAVSIARCCQRGNTPGDVSRGLGDRETWSAHAGITPAGLGDTEVLQHLL